MGAERGSGGGNGHCLDGHADAGAGDGVSVSLGGNTLRWASHCDADAAVASHTPCMLLLIPSYLYSSLYFSLNANLCNLVDVESTHESCSFQIANFFSFFKCVSPDNSQWGIR